MRQSVIIALLLFLISAVAVGIAYIFGAFGSDTVPAEPDATIVDSSGSAAEPVVAAPARNDAIRTLPGYSALQDQIDEQARLDTLSTVSSENLATQVETDAAGKKRLSSRRLLLNNLKTRNVKGASQTIAALEDIDKAVTRERIELTEVDVMLLLSGLRIEMPANDVCAGIDELGDAQKRSPFMPYLVRTCGE